MGTESKYDSGRIGPPHFLTRPPNLVDPQYRPSIPHTATGPNARARFPLPFIDDGHPPACPGAELVCATIPESRIPRRFTCLCATMYSHRSSSYSYRNSRHQAPPHIFSGSGECHIFMQLLRTQLNLWAIHRIPRLLRMRLHIHPRGFSHASHWRIWEFLHRTSVFSVEHSDRPQGVVYITADTPFSYGLYLRRIPERLSLS